MRLGFITGRTGARGVDGGYYAHASLGRVIDALASRADQTTVAMSVTGDHRTMHDHRISVPRDRMYELPRMESLKEGFWRHRDAVAVIRRVEAESDAVVVQLPFPTPSALVSPKKPRVYHLCADI